MRGGVGWLILRLHRGRKTLGAAVHVRPQSMASDLPGSDLSRDARGADARGRAALGVFSRSFGRVVRT